MRPSTPPPSSTDIAPPPVHRWRRTLTRIALVIATIVAIALLMVALVLAALHTESGTRLAWQAAARVLPGQLSGDVDGGTLADGLHLRNVVYEDATKRVHIDRLQSAWQLTRSPLLLTVRYLRMGRVDITLRPSPSPNELVTLPAEITVPLAFDLQRATVQELVVHRDGATDRFTDILLHAGSDGMRHRLDLDRVGTPMGKASATLRLDGISPFPVSGSAHLEGIRGKTPFHLDGRLSGNLREPVIRIDGAGAGLTLDAHIEATPFAPVPLRRASIKAQHVDPSKFNAIWPQADLDITAELAPVGEVPPSVTESQGLTVSGPVSVRNARPGAIDNRRLPFVSAHADVVLDARRQQFARLSITLPGEGTLTGVGELRGADQGELTLQAKGVNLRALHTKINATSLSGPLGVKLAGDTQQFDVQLADPLFTIVANATLGSRQITLHAARLEAGSARLEATGTLARDGESAYVLSGTLADFNPALFLASAPANRKQAWKVPDGRINMQLKAEGALRPALRADIAFDIRDSIYAGLPMTGTGTVRLAGTQMLPSDARLSVAGNRAALKGSFGNDSGKLHVTIDAPELARLGFGLAGRLHLDGQLAGSIERPDIDASYRGDNLAFGPYRLNQLSGKVRTQGLPGSAPDAPLALELDARGLQGDDFRLARLVAGIDGTYTSHTLDLTAAGSVRGRPLDARIAAQGRLRDLAEGMAWDGILRTLENTGFPRLSMTEDLPLAIAPGRIDLGATRLTVERATVDLEGFQYVGGRLRSEGTFRTLQVAHLLELQRQFTGTSPPLKTDLVLDGSWNVTMTDSASGFLAIERRSGDISLPQGNGRINVGLSALSLRADLQGDLVELQAQAESTRIGRVNSQGRIALLQSEGRLAIAPDASVSGRVEASIPRLQALGFLAGPEIVFGGSAGLSLDIDGTIAEPRLSGTAAGDKLELTLYDQGIRLQDGIARLVLNDNVVELQRVEFRGGDGTVRATGRLPLDRAREGFMANITADNLLLLSNPSAQMTISGRAEASMVNRQLQMTGKFVVDRALFSLPEKSPPELDDDVVVIRGGRQMGASGQQDIVPAGRRPPGPFSPEVNVQVNLGNDFRFEGSGAELRLAGEIDIRSAPNEAPQAFGTVRVVDGTYEAFGTKLAIERGVINFQGPFRNPNVNVLAMRRDQEVAAGVRILGTAQRPRVQLVSEPEVSDEEKLSWLVFGRSGGGSAGPGQAQAAARGAALGLLNKFGTARLAREFGLDELSIGESEFGLAGQQVVNFGKDISDRLHVGYEQSLAGAESVLKLTYDLSRSWSIVLRGGAVAGIEVFFSKRFDSLR